MDHLESHLFRLRNIFIIRLCGIMRVEEPSQIVRTPGGPVEPLAGALLESNDGLLPDLLDGAGAGGLVPL